MKTSWRSGLSPWVEALQERQGGWLCRAWTAAPRPGGLGAEPLPDQDPPDCRQRRLLSTPRDHPAALGDSLARACGTGKGLARVLAPRGSGVGELMRAPGSCLLISWDLSWARLWGGRAPSGPVLLRGAF